MAESNITRYVNYSEAIMENPAESQLLQSIQNINIPVKTVYVLPLPRTITFELLMLYFKLYGDLENIDVQLNDELSSAVVTYKRPEDASKVLSIRQHRILHHQINVYESNQGRKSPAEQLIDATKQTTSLSLLDLTDTCLTEIGQYCSLSDLLSMAGTCTRLKPVVTTVFNAKYKILDLTEFPELCTRTDFQRIVTNFGRGITELNIDDDDFAEESHITLGLIFEHCYHGSLESLKLSNFDMNILYDVRSQEVLRSLKKLELCGCELSQWYCYNFFVDFPQLVELKLDCVDRFETVVFPKSFPQLKSLTLDGTFMVTMDVEKFLHGFLDSHKNLTTLRLCRVNGNVASDSVLRFINENLHQLQTLHLTEKYYKNGFEPLPNAPILDNLRYLKELRLFCGSKPINVKFPRSLAHLYLDQVDLDKDGIRSIKTLSNLRELHLIAPESKLTTEFLHDLQFLEDLSEFHVQTHCAFTSRALVNFVKAVTKLQVLNITGIYRRDLRFHMKPITFEKISEICRNRNNDLELTITNTVSWLSGKLEYHDGGHAELYNYDYDSDEPHLTDSDDSEFTYHSDSNDDSESDDDYTGESEYYGDSDIKNEEA